MIIKIKWDCWPEIIRVVAQHNCPGVGQVDLISSTIRLFKIILNGTKYINVIDLARTIVRIIIQMITGGNKARYRHVPCNLSLLSSTLSYLVHHYQAKV